MIGVLCSLVASLQVNLYMKSIIKCLVWWNLVLSLSFLLGSQCGGAGVRERRKDVASHPFPDTSFSLLVPAHNAGLFRGEEVHVCAIFDPASGRYPRVCVHMPEVLLPIFQRIASLRYLQRAEDTSFDSIHHWSLYPSVSCLHPETRCRGRAYQG